VPVGGSGKQSSACRILNSNDCGVHADQCVEENKIAPGVAPDISMENQLLFPDRRAALIADVP